MPVQDKPLHDRQILIIENDYYQAEDSRDYLTRAGGVIIACKGTIPDLDKLLTSRKVDVALLDINLGHVQSFDLARELGTKQIPFVFLTGYDPDIVPSDLADAPVLNKPADENAVIRALVRELDGDGFVSKGPTGL
jgi:DNA-binding response OmpR family regulator